MAIKSLCVMDPCLLAGFLFIYLFFCRPLGPVTCVQKEHTEGMWVYMPVAARNPWTSWYMGKRQALGQERSEIRKSKDGGPGHGQAVLGVSLNIKPNQIL